MEVNTRIKHFAEVVIQWYCEKLSERFRQIPGLRSLLDGVLQTDSVSFWHV